MGSLEADLRHRLQSAFTAVAGDGADAALRRSKVADYQADGALALGGRLGRVPRRIAEEVVAAADLTPPLPPRRGGGPGLHQSDDR